MSYVNSSDSFVPDSYSIYKVGLPSTDWQYLEMYGNTFLSSTGGISTSDPITEKYSLQALVELVYVKEGNDLLGDKMSSLQTALSAAQGALSVLTDIQTLHNKIQIPSTESFTSAFPFSFTAGNQTVVVKSWSITSSKTSTNALDQTVQVPTTYTVFKQPPSGPNVSGPTNYTFKITDAGSYASVYNTLASAYYVPIDPTVVSSFTAMGSYLSQITTLKANLTSYMQALSTLPSDLRSGALPLLGRLSAVFNALPSSTPSAFENWVLDGQTSHGVAGVEKAGSIQTDINTAISAAESLNSAQNQVVRNFTFQFQQYMQSAAAILTALNQLYQNMSSNISRT